jgi:hypothetical protein
MLHLHACVDGFLSSLVRYMYMLRTPCMGMAVESLDTADRIHTSRKKIVRGWEFFFFCTVVNVAVWNRYLQAAVWWRRCCRTYTSSCTCICCSGTYATPAECERAAVPAGPVCSWNSDPSRTCVDPDACCYSMLVSVLSGWADIPWRGRVPMDCSGWAGCMVSLIDLEPSKYCCRKLN